MSKFIKYEFETTMREFCKYLAKQNIETIEPMSIVTDDSGSTIFYDENIQGATLELLFGSKNPPFEDGNLKTLPTTPSSLEKELWETLGPRNKLVEKNVGTYWRFVFNPETRILISLSRGGEIYHRTTGIPQFVTIEEDPELVFFCPKTKWEAHIIVLSHISRVEQTQIRPYTISVYGTQYYNLQLNGEITSENTNSISWYLHGSRD